MDINPSDAEMPEMLFVEGVAEVIPDALEAKPAEKLLSNRAKAWKNTKNGAGVVVRLTVGALIRIGLEDLFKDDFL
ncbi:hypothetical protein AB0399_15680 [Streptomyces sp. NPDC088194]|uniref:hypothetical protein n=1 Tax=Streptomyces sp. NPDC088194 TaxID=3154931 RepID=UPI00344E2CD5